MERGPDPRCGAVAQLGERHVRNVEVEGSSPFSSTISLSLADITTKTQQSFTETRLRVHKAGTHALVLVCQEIFGVYREQPFISELSLGCQLLPSARFRRSGGNARQARGPLKFWVLAERKCGLDR